MKSPLLDSAFSAGAADRLVADQPVDVLTGPDKLHAQEAAALLVEVDLAVEAPAAHERAREAAILQAELETIGGL